jgi:hypothetical protein
MDLAQFAMAGFVIIGLVNGIGFAVDRNWKAFVFFMTAVVAGGVFGFLRWFGLPGIEIGLAVGISSSGVYKVAQKLGGL